MKSLVVGIIAVLVVVCSTPVFAAECWLVWDAVTQDASGTPIPSTEINYRLYVVNISQSFIKGTGFVASTLTQVKCTDVGFTSGKKAVVTAFHIPSGEESDFSNQVGRLIINPSTSLHLEFR